MENSETAYWKRITFISFVLSIFIVIRHNSSFSNYTGQDAELLLKLYENFKHTITEIAVPLFFIISGFNYFRNYDPVLKWQKLKKRIRSLLMPYWFWNVIYTIFSIVTSYSFVAKYFIGRKKFEASASNIIVGCFWHWNCNPHFWFVFNLMLFTLINPLIYGLLRGNKTGFFTIIILYVVVIGLSLSLPGAFIYRTDSIVYYYIGAFLSLNCKERITRIGERNFRLRWGRSTILYYMVMILLLLQTILLLLPIYNWFKGLSILAGCYGAWGLTSVLGNAEIPKWINGGTTFLTYAMHGIIEPVLVKLIYLILPKDGWFSSVNFALSVLLTVGICIVVYQITQRYFNKLCNLMSGWR